MQYAYLTESLLSNSINSKTIKEEVMKRLNDGQYPEYFEHILMQCPKCECVHERLYIKFEGDTLSSYETKYKCHKCKRELIPVEEEVLEKSSCPKCKMKRFRIKSHVLWD
ncbi:MAG: hypothetical protein ACOZCL_14780 [Bacillota bacterium]